MQPKSDVPQIQFSVVKIRKPDEVNMVLGQAHFIKTVEDLYEALAGAVPGLKFGLAFAEASGACKVRTEGTDEELKQLAASNVMELACGHSFLILLRNAYPINVLNTVKAVSEVCCIYCASANPVEVVVARTAQGGGVMGVIDGASPKGIENDTDITWRKDLLRSIGYKR